MISESDANTLMKDSCDEALIQFFKNVNKEDKTKKTKIEACKKEIEKRGLKID